MSSVFKKIRMVEWRWAAMGAAFMFLVLSIVSRRFELASLTANITVAGYVTICALGQMVVMTTGRGAFDLSLPNMITLSAFLTMGLTNGQNSRFIPVLLLVLLAGAAVGLINSFLVIKLRITSMIATLGVGYMLSTLTSIYNRAFNVMQVSDIMLTFTRFKVLGLPLVTWFVLLLVAGMSFFMRRSTYGRALHALGQSQKAAQLAGIRVNRVETIAYVLGSMLAALCGFFLSGRIGGAFLGMGDSYLMDTVGSAVIGGTLASGGRSSSIGVFFGALFLSLVVTTMQVANFSVGVQSIVKGAIIVGVLVASMQRSAQA